MAVEMNRMSGWGIDFSREIREILGGDNKIDITLVVVLWNDGIFLIESCVIKIQNCRV